MVYMLVLFPLVMAVVTFAVPSGRWRPWLLPAGAIVQLGLAAEAIFSGEGAVITGLGGWLLLDALGKLILGFLSVLFFLCSLYAPGYLALRADRPNRTFCANLFATLAMMTMVSLSHHLGLMWVAMEATTLTSAPLIYFNHNARSLEATWKYLLIGSVGIALALFGSFFLAYSAIKANLESTLLFDQLIEIAPKLSAPWLHAAFVLLFIGYGTKMGLAPMHTWKPDAYGEAPGLVGAILAGGITTVAFTAILRVRAVVAAAGEGAIADRTLLAIGLFSMLVAALFLLGTRDFKRMLAYSSVEHMGILCVGAALGAAGVAAALFHLWSNALTKGSLFLSAGNIRRAAGSPLMDDVRGMTVLTPRSAALFVTGMFAVTACPPFGPFFSELLVVRAGLAAGHGPAIAIFLGCLLLAFFGLTRVVFGIVDGRPRPAAKANSKNFVETVGVVAPPLLLLGLSLWLGLFTPAILRAAWL